MSAATSPFCGLVQPSQPNGARREAPSFPANHPDKPGYPSPQNTVAGVLFESVMNWVVGLLLSAAITGLVFVQAHFQQRFPSILKHSLERISCI
jgi:hypothetical protein